MAAPGPPQQQNTPSSSVSAPQQPPILTNPDQVSWDGDKMFNIYILDYCKKRGYRKTATELVSEADISADSKPPINAQQGLLFEWWSVFWVLFQAKNNGTGSEDAMLFHKHQNQVKSRAGQVPPPGVPQGARFLPNGVTGPVSSLPGAHMNGIGPGGQPPSLSGPPPYGPTNPPGQPNGIPGPPQAPPGAPGQPFPGGMPGRTLGPQQRLSNGPQYRSPTIAPSPQAQGNPPQPPAGAMAQLGRSPHMSTIHRAAMPPPNGPQHPQGPGPTGSAHPTPTLPYQQVGRPPSRPDISSQNPMNPHQSPAMVAGRIPPQDRSHMDSTPLDNELASYPPDIIGDAKRHAGLIDRDPQSLTSEEKQNLLLAVRMRHNPPNGGIAGPSGVNTHGQMPNRGPMGQPVQAQLSMPQRGKRNSTSPGEQHPTLPRNDQSPPDRKRPRRTPNPAEQQQQQPQQQQQQQPQQSQPQPPPTPQQPQQTPQPPQQQHQQPPMAPMGPLPSGPQPGPGRGPLMAGGQPPNGFGGPPMHQMVGAGPMTPMHGMSPGMGHGPPMGLINPQMVQPQVLYQGQYRPGLVNPHKANPNVPVHPLDPQSHLRGAPGPQVLNRLSGPLVPTQTGQPPKVMGGPMPPPGQPGMNGPPKPGGKEGEGELNAPLNPAASAPTSGSLHNSGPPMNPQRPPTANAPMPTPAPPPAPAPGSMGELSFESYMTDMFGSNGGDFDFGPTELDNMDLWLDPTAHESSIGMK